ncbi:MAG TPA: ABC transporter permease [bacterium]|nr:ABC transporter permease [bacterium]
MISESLWGIWCVWKRYYAAFLKGILYYLLTTFLEPIFWMLSFGLGLGSLVNGITVQGHAMSYRSFIFSGIIAQTVLFQGYFEGSYGAFVRMYYQKIFQAIAITPVTLSEVLWGELLWDSTKATVAAEVVALIGVSTGDFRPSCLLTILPVTFLSAFLFSALGLTAAGYSRTIDELSYPQYLLIFPMFLFCGVFYPIENLPLFLQKFAWFFPLTSVNSILRSLTLGLPLAGQAVPLLLLWLGVMVWVSRRSMFKRLVK